MRYINTARSLKQIRKKERNMPMSTNITKHVLQEDGLIKGMANVDTNTLF